MSRLLVDCRITDLLIGDCPVCEKLHLFGFYSQIPKEHKSIDLDEMIVTITEDCRNCGCEVRTVRHLRKGR